MVHTRGDTGSKTRGRSSPSPVLRRTSDEDKAVFLRISFNSSSSVMKEFPRVTDCGQTGVIPIHIRACSRNPRKVFLAMAHFRRMSSEEQAKHVKAISDLTAWARKPYDDNLKYLLELQENLIAGDVKWEDVAPDPGDEAPRFPRAAKRQKKDQGASVVTSETSEDVIDKAGDWWLQEFQLRQKAEEDFVAQQEAEARRQNAGRSNTNNNENVDPSDLLEDGIEEEDGNKKKSHVGLVSSSEERDAEADRVEEQSKSGKRRKPGTPCTELYQQSDAASNLAVESALKHVARASDTIHHPKRLAGQPQRNVLFLDVNEVADTRPHGGITANDMLQRKDTQVTFAGHRNRQDIRFVLTRALECFAQEETPGYQRVELNPNAFDDSAQTTVVNFIDARRAGRSQPARTPRGLDEVVRDIHRELRESGRSLGRRRANSFP